MQVLHAHQRSRVIKLCTVSESARFKPRVEGQAQHFSIIGGHLACTPLERQCETQRPNFDAKCLFPTLDRAIRPQFEA
jgi:hypothetical protein